MNVKEAAKLAGISVRALHHYDEIGLLCPRRSENGYRDYSGGDLDRLQQILFFRECGFPLGKIRELMESGSFDREKAFELQRNCLLFEKKRIETMLETLERSIRSMKGEITMSEQEKFGGFGWKNPYEQEARRRWGDAAVDASGNYLSSLSEEQRKSLSDRMDTLFSGLAGMRGEDPASPPVQRKVGELYRFFNGLGYRYTPRAFAGLGELYVADERFTRNIDRYGEGLSRFLKRAMRIYADHLEP